MFEPFNGCRNVTASKQDIFWGTLGGLGNAAPDPAVFATSVQLASNSSGDRSSFSFALPLTVHGKIKGAGTPSTKYHWVKHLRSTTFYKQLHYIAFISRWTGRTHDNRTGRGSRGSRDSSDSRDSSACCLGSCDFSLPQILTVGSFLRQLHDINAMLARCNWWKITAGFCKACHINWIILRDRQCIASQTTLHVRSCEADYVQQYLQYSTIIKSNQHPHSNPGVISLMCILLTGFSFLSRAWPAICGGSCWPGDLCVCVCVHAGAP